VRSMSKIWPMPDIRFKCFGLKKVKFVREKCWNNCLKSVRRYIFLNCLTYSFFNYCSWLRAQTEKKTISLLQKQ
jgi:endonuclease V-like protein UPF0215 family